MPESPGQPEMSSSEPRHTVPRRLLLVDGDVNARRGLTLLIGDEPDMVVAGEASGDMHGARLVQEIKRLAPSARFFGIGGPRIDRKSTRLNSSH